MGKSKTTKFKRPHFSVGLPVNDVKEVDAEEFDNDGPAAELLEKVRAQPLYSLEYPPMSLFELLLVCFICCLFICHYDKTVFCVSSAAESQSRCARIGMCQHFQGGSAESHHTRISPKGCREASGANAVGQQCSRQGNCCWSTQVSGLPQSCGLQTGTVVFDQPATSDSAVDDDEKDPKLLEHLTISVFKI